MAWIYDNRIKYLRLFSPRPAVFRKTFEINKKIIKAQLKCSALGIYVASLNGQKIGDYFLTPGFTSYKNHLQMQTFDILPLLFKNNELDITLTGGWAAGRFGLNRLSKNYVKKPALWFEVHLEYEDGTNEVLESDSTCLVGRNGYLASGIYSGETFDATKEANCWKNADIFTLPFNPKIIEGGPYVKAHEELKPVSIIKSKKGYIYDFGQNFAGVIAVKINADVRQKVIFRHAEILKKGELCTTPLRTAKQRIIYYTKIGEQQYVPQTTYMGFRYVEVKGIDPTKLQLSAFALYSDIPEIGDFTCSNPLLNRLQNNIKWSAKSNFVDIPTDCPQRDERLGWTADTAVFASTACFNFGMHDMYEKWLLSLRDDQGEKGQIPDVIPRVNMKNTRSAPVWADAAAIVPWSSYLAYGDINTLKNQYISIKRYIEDGKTHLTDYVWDKGFQYGDWCAPGVNIKVWKARGKYVGTCYFANSVKIAANISLILDNKKAHEEYMTLFENICRGFERRFVNKDGTIKGEFQSAYVLPLYFGLLPHHHQAFAKNLARLIEENDYHLSTGFAGTPYLLFALADHGYLNHAYKVLLKDTCPSWLYEIKSGATTMWERWDAIKPNGKIFNPFMLSFNHYAYGAVGDFLYRRIAGIEALEPGYKKSRIAPKPGGNLTSASAFTNTPYGKISAAWNIVGEQFCLEVIIPKKTMAEIVLPSGKTYIAGSGKHLYKEAKTEI